METSSTTNPVIRSCSLEITGRTLDPSEVSLKLDEEADRSFKRGDLSAHGRPRFQGAWSIESDRHVSSPEVQDHLAYIISFLERRKPEILNVKKTLGASVRIRIFWNFDMTISFAINEGALKSLAEIVDGFDFSIT